MRRVPFPPFFSTRFDMIGEDATPPLPFRPLLTWMGRVQPLPACYWHVSTQLGRAQPLPALFNPFWHEWGGFNPCLLVRDAFRCNWGGYNPSPPFFDPIQCGRRGFNPSMPVLKWFNTNREGAPPSHSFQPLSFLTCFSCVLTWPGWVQPHPTHIWCVLMWPEDATGSKGARNGMMATEKEWGRQQRQRGRGCTRYVRFFSFFLQFTNVLPHPSSPSTKNTPSNGVFFMFADPQSGKGGCMRYIRYTTPCPMPNNC